MPVTPASQSADADEPKRERFERLKAQYRQQLREARTQGSTPTVEAQRKPKPATPSASPATAPSVAAGGVARTMEKPQVNENPRRDALPNTAPAAEQSTASARTPLDSSHLEGSSADDSESCISVSPLTTPGASYSSRVRPPSSSQHTAGVSLSSGVSRTKKPAKTASAPRKGLASASPKSCHQSQPVPNSDTSRGSFATDFAELYGPSSVSTEPSMASAPNVSAVSAKSERPEVGSSVGTRSGLQLRMSQRPLSDQRGANSPTTLSPAVKHSGNRANNGRTPQTVTAAPKVQADAAKGRAVSAHGAQIEQMEAVMDYLESLTNALAQRTKSLPPPESLVSFRASITPATRHEATTTDTATEAHFSLLSELHETSSLLLSWFSKLEYPQLPKDTTVDTVEQNTLRACRDVAALVDRVDRKFTTHEAVAVREGYAERQHAVVAHRELLDAVARTAQRIVILRRLVHARDLYQVREIVDVHKKEAEATATTVVARRHVEAMFQSSYLTWVEQRWLPAMQSWKRITHTALQEARSTGQYSAAISKAERESLTVPHLHEILRADETLSDLHRVDVVAPIEAMASDGAELEAAVRELEAALVTPRLADLAKAIRRVQTCLGDAGAVPAVDSSPTRHVEDDGTHALSPHAAAATTADAATDKTTAERALVKRAQQLLVEVQQAESSLRTMQMAIRVPGNALSLFQVVHKANELLYQLNLGAEAARMQNVVRLCRPIAQQARHWRTTVQTMAATESAVVVECDQSGESCTSPWRSPSRVSLSPHPHGASVESVVSDSALSSVSGAESAGPHASVFWLVDQLSARGLTVEDLYVPHRSSNVWTAQCAEAYQRLCDALVQTYHREEALAALDRVLRQASARSHRSYGDNEADADTSSLTRSDSHSAACDTLRVSLQRAEALGLSAPLLDKAREQLAQWQSLRLKIHFQAQTRLLQLIDPTNARFDEVYDQIYAFCVEQAMLSRSAAVARGQELRIRYEDVDGDFISIVNDADWALMLSETSAASAASGRKVDLFCDFPILPGSDPAALRQHSTLPSPQTATPPDTASTPTTAPGTRTTQAAATPTVTPATEQKRTPGMTRSAALRLAAARSRSAGVPSVSRSAAFAPRSHSGSSRVGRTPPAPSSGGEDAGARLARRVAPRRALSDASVPIRSVPLTAARLADAASHDPPLTQDSDASAPVPDAPPRGTVHKNILDGAKRWAELAPNTTAAEDVLELMTTATTVTTASPSRVAPPLQAASPMPQKPQSLSTEALGVDAQPTTTRTVLTPHAKPSAAALALPPRPNPASHPPRTLTPHRRLSRRGSQSELNAPGGAAHSRSTDDLIAEMMRLQEENGVAMHKRATPHS